MLMLPHLEHYQVTYDCQDAAGNNAIQVIRTVTVTPTPQVLQYYPQSMMVIINEGQVKSFTVTATDENNDTITYPK